MNPVVEKIRAWLKVLPTIPIDKQGHFLGGAVVALTVGLISLPVIGFVTACCAGALKEWYDYKHPPHAVELFDFLATALGGVAGAVFLWVVK